MLASPRSWHQLVSDSTATHQESLATPTSHGHKLPVPNGPDSPTRASPDGSGGPAGVGPRRAHPHPYPHPHPHGLSSPSGSEISVVACDPLSVESRFFLAGGAGAGGVRACSSARQDRPRLGSPPALAGSPAAGGSRRELCTWNKCNVWGASPRRGLEQQQPAAPRALAAGAEAKASSVASLHTPVLASTGVGRGLGDHSKCQESRVTHTVDCTPAPASSCGQHRVLDFGLAATAGRAVPVRAAAERVWGDAEWGRRSAGCAPLSLSPILDAGLGESIQVRERMVAGGGGEGWDGGAGVASDCQDGHVEPGAAVSEAAGSGGGDARAGAGVILADERRVLVRRLCVQCKYVSECKCVSAATDTRGAALAWTPCSRLRSSPGRAEG